MEEIQNGGESWESKNTNCKKEDNYYSVHKRMTMIHRATNARYPAVFDASYSYDKNMFTFINSIIYKTAFSNVLQYV